MYMETKMNSRKANIEEYILTIPNMDKKNYILEIMNELDKKNENIAFHGSCTDGSITAALLYLYKPEKTYIPLDYNILKDAIIRKYLIKQNWFAIVDLEPFNKHPLELYIDHHRSVIGQTINSKRIHFEVGELGPSAAFVLYNSLIGTVSIPDYMKLLVDVSKVTDTASFRIDPPIEIVTKDNLSFLEDFDKLCWFVQDATNVEENYTLQKNNNLIMGLAKEGINFLLSNDMITNVNNQRSKRNLAQNFINNLTITPLMVIINTPDNSYKQFISLKLGKLGAKVIVFLNQKDDIITISLRQSKLNSKDEIEFYRLDLFAKKFNKSGGGHAEASGSTSPSLDYAFGIVKKWAKEKKLKYSVNEYN